MGDQSKYWSFTIPNPTGELTFNEAKMDYLIYAHEWAPTTGLHHLQGYVAMKKRVRRSGLKKLFAEGHFTPSKGTAQHNIDYLINNKDKPVPKPEHLFQYGEPTGLNQGARTDIERARDAIIDGADHKEMIMQHPGVVAKYPKFIDTCLDYWGQERDWSMEIIIYWGPTGTGKTYRAKSEYPRPNRYIKDNNKQWWQRYRGQETVIWDEFNPTSISIEDLLLLCGDSEMVVYHKGSAKNFVSKRIVFTSNQNPETWYPWTIPQHKDAFFRRVTRIEHMTIPYNK